MSVCLRLCGSNDKNSVFFPLLCSQSSELGWWNQIFWSEIVTNVLGCISPEVSIATALQHANAYSLGPKCLGVMASIPCDLSSSL